MLSIIKSLLTLTCTALVFCLSLTISLPDEALGAVTIVSDPPGGEVTLEGDLTVAGISQTTFDHILIGKYRLTVRRHGYETYKTWVTLDPSQHAQIDVSLSPLTPLKAGGRSLLLPGWGQRYSGQKAKGFIFTLLAASSVAGFFIADHQFDSKYDDFNRMRDAFDAAATFQQKERLEPLLKEAQKEAYDAENTRRIAIGAVIGVWALSVVDAVLFFPKERSTFSVKGFKLQPQSGTGDPGLKLSYRF